MLACKQWLLTAGVVVALACASPAQAEANPFRGDRAVEEVARPEAKDSGFKPITQLGVDIAPPAGKLPRIDAAMPLAGVPLAGDLPRPWPTQVFQWQAAATHHQPLYFEEVNAEHYGYSCNWVAQPFISTAHFFATIPALPYLKTANCPWECQYTLGHYRPGSCPPYRRHCWPVDCLAATSEAGAIAWMIVVLP